MLTQKQDFKWELGRNINRFFGVTEIIRDIALRPAGLIMLGIKSTKSLSGPEGTHVR